MVLTTMLANNSNSVILGIYSNGAHCGPVVTYFTNIVEFKENGIIVK